MKLFVALCLIAGGVQVQAFTGSCAGSYAAGEVAVDGYYPQYCDGSNWQNMKGPSAGACSSANVTQVTATDYQFCDGANWYSLLNNRQTLGSCANPGGVSWNGSSLTICLGSTLYAGNTPTSLITLAFQNQLGHAPTASEIQTILPLMAESNWGYNDILANATFQQLVMTDGAAACLASGSCQPIVQPTPPTPTPVTPTPVTLTAYYVSPAGSDSNNGASTSTPFQTLEKAQAAMQTTAIKTTYLMGGTFKRTATLNLGAGDSGESWLGLSGQVPVLDGGSTTAAGITDNGGNNITIRWLTLQNFTQRGMLVGGSGLLIDSNTILNTESSAWSEGGIVGYNCVNCTVTHNLINGSQYAGIIFGTFGPGTINNLLIAYNSVNNVCESVADCGALYVVDTLHTSTGVVINNNVVHNWGTVTDMSRAIYLDDEVSNVNVTNNIVSGVGESALAFHGGDHNTVSNNIFDISGAAYLASYGGEDASGSLPNYGMAVNAFTCNIVYSTRPPPSSAWTGIDFTGGYTVAVLFNNLYYDPYGSLNVGEDVDQHATTANPNFINPANGNYSSTSLPAFCNQGQSFHPIDVSTVGPLPH